MSVEPIRVELESFCQQFTTALEPFNEALEQGTNSLREAMKEASLQAPLGDLQDNRHRLKILLDKARQQNTYLVIFGPLKSGKSTLMNAISGAYVSEVTSLPAYPCLVYVKEGESHGFSTTAFNGDRSEFGSREALHSSLQAAHQTLAEKIREADAADVPFNPAQDYTGAIRRIDFTMPAPYLRESGTILVDTPGLYTKMKYSYGQLTRDFRDTAACAVFVVKTDNLFFEQVFEEFADLLDVFSRVFLVVNIDSSKQDLGPDGRLEPSLEQRDPKQVIDAFENLTVSAQIRDAIDSGRLRIYMIDLLQTATQSLQAGDPMPQMSASTSDGKAEATEDPDTEASDSPETDASEADTAGEEADATPAPTASPAEVVTESGPRLGFERFLTDLTDYLNSSEYIAEFMADSLRQADSILREVGDRARAPEIAEFRAGIESLESQLETTERQIQTLDELRRHEWSGPLEALTAEIRQQVTEHSGSVLPELEKTLQGEVEAWAESDETMRNLVEDRIGSKISDVCRRSRARAVEIFHLVCRDRNGGVQIGDEVGRQLKALELSFDDIYAEFQTTVREKFEPAPELPDASSLQEEIPLRRRFFDWIFFRGDARIRQSVFGSENPSEQPFPAKAKAKRLGEEEIREFCGLVGDYARRCNLVTLEEVLENLLRAYREAFLADARQRVEARREVLVAESEEVRKELELRSKVVDALGALEAASSDLKTRVLELQERFIPDKTVIQPEQVEEDLEAEVEFPEDIDDSESSPD